ncbi:hypothetical protein AB0L59_38945 [Streptomyces sp. NPDC052109]|uniref:hypothetical protein n=1 Tax=Streptomyces sp. NPDC052109 TaxID=3155527 RepID=UPI003444CB2D
MSIDQRSAELGSALPPAAKVSPGQELPFTAFRVHGDRACVRGHAALGPDGAPVGPYGSVPSGLVPDAARESGRQATLSVPSDLRPARRGLDRLTATAPPLGRPALVSAEVEITG